MLSSERPLRLRARGSRTQLQPTAAREAERRWMRLPPNAFSYRDGSNSKPSANRYQNGIVAERAVPKEALYPLITYLAYQRVA